MPKFSEILHWHSRFLLKASRGSHGELLRNTTECVERLGENKVTAIWWEKKITCRGVDLAKFADWTVTAGGNEVQVDSLTFVCEAKAAQEQQTVVQSGEQREAAAERVVPEEELEHGGLLVPAGPPVRVGHGELVQVGEQRGGPLPDRPLHNPACAAGRRCHVIQVLVPGSLMPRSLGLAVLQTTAESRRYRGNNRAETHRQRQAAVCAHTPCCTSFY